MKKSLLSLLMIFSLNAFSAIPTLVECSGDNIYVRYERKSMETWRLFIGKKEELDLSWDFESDRSPIGRILSQVVETVPDAYTAKLSVVIPEINLRLQKSSIIFTSQVIKSKTMTSIMGPSGVDGLINEVSEIIPVKCTASVQS